MVPRLSFIGAVAMTATMALAAPTGAQTCTATGTTPAQRTCSVSVTPTSPVVLPKLGRLTLTASSIQALTNPSYAQFDAGFVLDSMAYTASANAPWNLQVTSTSGTVWQVFANDATYGSFVPAWTGKPSTTGQLSVNNASGFVGASSVATAFASALAAGKDLPGYVYWRTIFDYGTDRPGTYRLPVSISIVVP